MSVKKKDMISCGCKSANHILFILTRHTVISHTLWTQRLLFHPSEQRNGTVYELTMKILFLTNRSVGVFRARFSCAEQRVKLNIHYSSEINSLLLTVRFEYFQFVFFSLSHGSLSWTFAFFFYLPLFSTAFISFFRFPLDPPSAEVRFSPSLRDREITTSCALCSGRLGADLHS